MSTARHRISFTDLVNGEIGSWTYSIVKFMSLILSLASAHQLHVFPPDSPHFSDWLPQNGFASNFVPVTFIIICWENPYLFKILTKKSVILREDLSTFHISSDIYSSATLRQRTKWCLAMKLLSIFHIVDRDLCSSTVHSDLIAAFPCQQCCHRTTILRYEYIPYSNIYPTRCNVTQFILYGNCSTYFEWYHHPSSGAQPTVFTASGICHTVTANCRYRGRVGTGLSVLWVAYATHSTLIYISTPIENWTHVYMNLFTRNSLYYHLLKYLLFLLKHPVCIYYVKELFYFGHWNSTCEVSYDGFSVDWIEKNEYLGDAKHWIYVWELLKTCKARLCTRRHKSLACRILSVWLWPRRHKKRGGICTRLYSFVYGYLQTFIPSSGH